MAHKQQIRDLLNEGVVRLLFEKADGSPREMHATLNSNWIRWEPSAKDNKLKPPSDTSLAIWDTEKDAWRAFRWDRLREVNDMKFPQGVHD